VARLPSWLHKAFSAGKEASDTAHSIKKRGLCTVCEEAKCPNLPECYHQKRATFLLLGSLCTRSCGFCSVGFCSSPQPPDPEEPKKIAEYCQDNKLQHVVLTMVTRDDLEDGGASHIVSVMREIRSVLPEAGCEILTSDFARKWEPVKLLLDEKPEVLAHNLETVRALSSRVRSQATYEGSLALLTKIKKERPEQVTKSSIMLGLGESKPQVFETIEDLARAGIDMITIGQYLQPTPKQLAVKEFIHPDLFAEYGQKAKECGIQEVMVGPFVRSSYAARPIRRKK